MAEPIQVPCRILLAAGSGRRFGGNKRLALHAGKPLLRWAAETLLAGPPGPAVCVLPPGAGEETALLADLAWHVCMNPEAAAGQGSSLARAVADASQNGWGTQGWLVGLADLPDLAPSTVEAVLHASAREPNWVWVPRHQNTPGHPVFLPTAWTLALTRLQGDQGARLLRAQHPESVRYLEVSDPGCVRDRDTPDPQE